MKKINIIKISLDILMAVVFVLLFNKMVFNGMTFHEVAGLTIGSAFIIHMLLNGKWIKQVSKNLFSKKVAVKTKIGYIIDTLLLISMIIIIFSGIAISKVLFTNLNLSNSTNLNLKAIHTAVSYVSLILVGIHVGLHWNWITGMVKKAFKIPQNKAFAYAAKLAMVLVLAFGIYSCYSTGFLSKVAMITTVFEQRQGPAMGERPNSTANGSTENSTQQPSGGSGNSSTQQSSNRGGSNGMQQPPDGGTKMMPEGAQGHDKSGNMGSTNPFDVLISYLSVMSVFAIFTYYLEKLLTKGRYRKNQVLAAK